MMRVRVRVKKNDKDWKCSAFCKPLTQSEVDSILLLKRKFEESVRKVQKKLDTCDDGCPNTHFTKVVTDEHSDTLYSSVERRGHPLVCFLDGGGCESQLRAALRCIAKLLEESVQCH